MTIIRVADLETTGESPENGAPCEVGYVDLIATSFDLLGAPTAWEVKQEINDFLLDPGHQITPETAAIHHIQDEDLIGAPAWQEGIAHACSSKDEKIIAFAAHQAKFEQQWFTVDVTDGVPWICTYKCSLRLWPDAPGFSNQTLRYWRKPEGLIRDKAALSHRAGPDAYVTAFHVRDMLNLAPIEQLIEWSSQPAMLTKMNFGQQRGEPWVNADDGFLDWVLARDFDEDVMFTARTIKARRAYAGLAIKLCQRAETIEDLVNWFRDEAKERMRLGIIKGVTEYDRIVDACAEHKARIQRPATPRGHADNGGLFPTTEPKHDNRNEALSSQ